MVGLLWRPLMIFGAFIVQTGLSVRMWCVGGSCTHVQAACMCANVCLRVSDLVFVESKRSFKKYTRSRSSDLQLVYNSDRR